MISIIELRGINAREKLFVNIGMSVVDLIPQSSLSLFIYINLLTAWDGMFSSVERNSLHTKLLEIQSLLKYQQQQNKKLIVEEYLRATLMTIRTSIDRNKCPRVARI